MDDDQQFCLRWNNHQSTLVSVFDTLLESGTLVDCTLAAEGKFLKAHKVVLSACSPYFAALLSQQYDKHPIFILKDVKFQELRAMMDYMYRGEVNISQDQLSALLKAAESLQIKGLSDSRGAQKPQTLEQKQQLGVPIVGVKLPTTSGYTLESKKIRHAGGIGPTSLDSQELPISRESSSSPTSRKRKKIRRRSVENIPTETQEHSNSSSHSVHINSTAPTVTSTAITSVSTSVSTPSSSTSSTVTAVTGNIVPATAISGTKKTESVANAKLENMEREIDDNGDNRDENDKLIISGKKEQNIKQRKLQQPGETNETSNTDNTEMLIEPKNEYDDGNETVEDLTLDDEELEDLEQAGPSHGGGEGSSQGYAQWQVDRSQDEMFITTQEAAAAQQRDPQAKHDKSEQTDITPEEFELDDCLLESNDIVITQNKDGFVLHVKKLGNITTSKIPTADGHPTAHSVSEHHAEITTEEQTDTKPTLTSLATCQIKLPSAECGKSIQGKTEKTRENVIVVPKSGNIGEVIYSKLINLKKVPQASVAGQAIATATIIQPQVQEHASIVTANQQAINNLLGLREVNIQSKNLGPRIKYSRGKFPSPIPQQQGNNAPTTVQITEKTDTDMSEKKYEIAEIDLNNPQASASIISDLVKYAEIDDIELPDGTKIGIGFAPAELGEHMQTTTHQQTQVTTDTNSPQQSPGRHGQEQTITKSYTILTTTPIKQQQQTTYELSISDNSMSQSEDNDKLYVCRHCGKKYRWKSTLRRHENVECGGKEPCHPCPYCSYKAKQRGNLGVHVRKHHPDKPQLESKRGRRPT